MSRPTSDGTTPATLLLASARPELVSKLHPALAANHLQLEVAPGEADALIAMRAEVAPAMVLLDAGLPGTELPQLLAMVREEHGRRFPIVLLADTVTEDWAQRLAEGVIDDVILTASSALYWQMRIASNLGCHRTACELEKLQDESLQNMQLDPLTGAYNRESLLSMLFSETDRVQRSNSSLCMILMDVDDFAHWNALYGSELCDDLLRQIVARTRRQLRSYDLLGRAGKDEFIVALPGCSGVNAVMLAERVRQEVFSYPYKVANENIRITACFGVAMSRGRSPMVVLREAEIALQLAKEDGPETIQCYSDDGRTSLAYQSPGVGEALTSW